ncbi:thiamine pyrophosphate-dependent enzyme [Kineosporia sp. NBRC 101731]|uniref:thiamine pyrophosphate-dependent enzyme n=1 Tax=Kineosporia sp. NBRC 101731 TaxID=3032199 RepID=UPI0024A27CC8|nr:thiamine pyrophosphate-dependent enzyme [Kineosporia sp. NBRC 101731]GLY28191.1 pyruvate dehydrogenase [Kineosporia sp. NBRC 101731]
MTTVADMIIDSLHRLGVRTVWGVVGDALNPLTDAIRRNPDMRWIGVRHEEAGAFAAGAQAQVSGTLGVCMGTVGPGSIHLLNGLYDAKKSQAPVLAICGQVPTPEIGSDYFQEVDNDLLFTDVAAFRATVTSAAQMPRLLSQAVNAAYAGPGVAVLTLPGDVGEMEMPADAGRPHFVTARPVPHPDPQVLEDAVALLEEASNVTILAGIGAAAAKDELLALAGKLGAPMVLTIKGKGLEEDNPFEVGQSGLIGNPASKTAFDGADVLLMVGTDFPYPEWLPKVPTIQIDVKAEHIGRRTPVQVGLVADAAVGVRSLTARVTAKPGTDHLDQAREHYADWRERQQALLGGGKGSLPGRILAKARRPFENPSGLIRPELLADVIDRVAADDAVITTDTGMSTVWASRFLRMRGNRQLVGSFGLGSMANAMPQALGVQALDTGREVVSLSGDGGLTMLLGDLITAVVEQLPVRVVVFNNGRLGMVKLEQEQVGLPEFGTVLTNPDLAAVALSLGWSSWRVEKAEDLEETARKAFATAGPVLLDVLTNPDEISLPPQVTSDKAWGFAIAKVKETLESPA